MKTLVAGSLVLLLTLSALAGTEDELGRVIDDTTKSPEPATALILGLAGLPDVTLTGSEVEASVAARGAKSPGPTEQLLGGLTSLKKTGDRVEMSRAQPVLIPIAPGGKVQGYIWLDKTATFNVHRAGDTVTVDGTDGVKVGVTEDKLATLRSLRYVKADPPQPIELVAGSALLHKTVLVHLPAAPAPVPPPSETGGLTGSLSPAE